jgi:hypothetical protein
MLDKKEKMTLNSSVIPQGGIITPDTLRSIDAVAIFLRTLQSAEYIKQNIAIP